MSWLRLDDAVPDNPKVQRLPPLLFRAWINLLCIAKQYGGVLPEMCDVAYKLRVTEMRAEQMVKDLVAERLFDEKDGHIVPHDWNDWQFKSDRSTERVKQHRERKRNVTCNDDETFHHETVETHQNRTEQNIYAKAFQPRWEKYPNRIGRKAAERHFSASVKSEDDLTLIDRALDNYLLCLKVQPDRQVQNGSTWFNNWRDWIDWKPMTRVANADIRAM